MSNLVLELRQGDMMIVNGAAIRFRNKARIELTSRARFLFGKQIMSAEEADSPARRIYYALQAAYIGEAAERPQALQRARELVGAFVSDAGSALAGEILEQALAAAEADDCYRALRLARQVVRYEDGVRSRAGRAAPGAAGALRAGVGGVRSESPARG